MCTVKIFKLIRNVFCSIFLVYGCWTIEMTFAAQLETDATVNGDASPNGGNVQNGDEILTPVTAIGNNGLAVRFGGGTTQTLTVKANITGESKNFAGYGLQLTNNGNSTVAIINDNAQPLEIKGGDGDTQGVGLQFSRKTTVDITDNNGGVVISSGNGNATYTEGIWVESAASGSEIKVNKGSVEVKAGSNDLAMRLDGDLTVNVVDGNASFDASTGGVSAVGTVALTVKGQGIVNLGEMTRHDIWTSAITVDYQGNNNVSGLTLQESTSIENTSLILKTSGAAVGDRIIIASGTLNVKQFDVDANTKLDTDGNSVAVGIGGTDIAANTLTIIGTGAVNLGVVGDNNGTIDYQGGNAVTGLTLEGGGSNLVLQVSNSAQKVSTSGDLALGQINADTGIAINAAAGKLDFAGIDSTTSGDGSSVIITGGSGSITSTAGIDAKGATADAGGNSGNITINTSVGNGDITITNVSLNGGNSNNTVLDDAGGNGGNLILNAGSGSVSVDAITTTGGAGDGNGAAGTTGTVEITGGNVNVSGSIVATGGISHGNHDGGSGASVTITANTGTIVTSNIATFGNSSSNGAAVSKGGNGGDVTINSSVSNGDVTTGMINAFGGAAVVGSDEGGKGGTVTIHAGNGLISTADIKTYGGDSSGTGVGGNGGDVVITGGGLDTNSKTIKTNGGASSQGGAGSSGDVSITVSGNVDIANTIDVEGKLGRTDGGTAGNITIDTRTSSAGNGIVTVNSFYAGGGRSSSNGAGGAGGNVDIKTNNSDVLVDSVIWTKGGNASGSGHNGGAGGDLTIDAGSGIVRINNSIWTYGGETVDSASGKGGAVRITAGEAVAMVITTRGGQTNTAGDGGIVDINTSGSNGCINTGDINSSGANGASVTLNAGSGTITVGEINATGGVSGVISVTGAIDAHGNLFAGGDINLTTTGDSNLGGGNIVGASLNITTSGADHKVTLVDNLTGVTKFDVDANTILATAGKNFTVGAGGSDIASNMLTITGDGAVDLGAVGDNDGIIDYQGGNAVTGLTLKGGGTDLTLKVSDSAQKITVAADFEAKLLDVDTDILFNANNVSVVTLRDIQIAADISAQIKNTANTNNFQNAAIDGTLTVDNAFSIGNGINAGTFTVGPSGKLVAGGGLTFNGADDKLELDFGDENDTSKYARVEGVISGVTITGDKVMEVYGKNGVNGEIYLNVFTDQMIADNGDIVEDGTVLNTGDGVMFVYTLDNIGKDIKVSAGSSSNIEQEVQDNGGSKSAADAVNYIANNSGNFDSSGQKFAAKMGDLSGGALARAAEETIGEGTTLYVDQATMVSIQASSGAVGTQMTAFRSGNVSLGMSSSFSSAGGATAALNEMVDAEILADAYDSVSGEGYTAASEEEYKKVLVWANGFGGFGEQATVDEQIGYDYWSAGGIIGFDYAFAKELRIGGLLGYSFNKATRYWNMGYSNDNAIRFGAYGSYAWNKFFFDFSPTMGVHMIHSYRNVFTGAVAEGERTCFDFNVNGKIGYEFELPLEFRFIPSFSLSYTMFHDPEYTETGAEAANISYDSFTSNSLIQDLGGKLGRLFVVNDRFSLLPEVWGGWEVEYLNTGGYRNTTTSPSIGLQSYTTMMNGMATHRYYWGTGLTALVNNNVSVFARYDHKIWENGFSVGLAAGVKIAF